MSAEALVLAVWVVIAALLARPVARLLVPQLGTTWPETEAIPDALFVGMMTILVSMAWPFLLPVWAIGRWAIEQQRGLDDE